MASLEPSLGDLVALELAIWRSGSSLVTTAQRLLRRRDLKGDSQSSRGKMTPNPYLAGTNAGIDVPRAKKPKRLLGSIYDGA